MIERLDGRLCVTVPMTMAHARALVQVAHTFAAKEEIVDLGQVREADSSAIAVLLAWLRDAERRGVRLAVANLPAGVAALADLYGVAPLIPRA